MLFCEILIYIHFLKIKVINGIMLLNRRIKKRKLKDYDFTIYKFIYSIISFIIVIENRIYLNIGIVRNTPNSYNSLLIINYLFNIYYD